MMLKDLDVLLIDCQTTGMRPSNGSLLELAWARVRALDADLKVHSTLVALPEEQSVPYRVTEITGIRNEDLIGAPTLEEVFKTFKDAVGDFQSPAVIHYAQFEKPFLLDLYSRFEEREDLPFEVVCSHALLKRLFPSLPSQNIRGAAGFFGDSVSQVKRAESHVRATFQIWRGLTDKLGEVGIHDLEALRALMAAPKEKRKLKYDYRIDRAKRLDLPDCPGVYRMLSKSGEVLYVGKATSLKSRVNSYFRGQRGRDRRKLEMLSQTWDLDVTSCKTALEAALLEADEIKRLNPPYNIMLKRGRRHLLFYSRDFSSASQTQNADHPIGPFRSQNWMDHLVLLERSLRTGHFEQIFYLPIDEEILREGFQIFLERHNLNPDIPWTVRKLLAYGLSLYRNYTEPENPVPESASNTDADTDTDADVGTGSGSIAATETDPQSVSEKFERLLRRAGAEYWRSRQMTALLNSRIEFKADGETRSFEFTHGRIGGERPQDATHAWEGLDIDTYDRLSILLTELAKYEHHIERG